MIIKITWKWYVEPDRRISLKDKWYVQIIVIAIIVNYKMITCRHLIIS